MFFPSKEVHMTTSKPNLFAGLALAAVLATGTGAAQADSGVQVGTLNCDVAGGIGLILGSSKSMTCVFHRADGAVENYAGSISKFGVDIGITGEQFMSWVVFAPGSVEPGALAGTYGGATAEATVGVGVGANVLVGGSGNSIALQPLSVTGQTGLNVAAGVAALSLRAQ
jgi:hypothetical protein